MIGELALEGGQLVDLLLDLEEGRHLDFLPGLLLQEASRRPAETVK